MTIAAGRGEISPADIGPSLAVEHPSWCDPAACTARPISGPFAEARFGSHASRAVSLGDLGGWLFLGVRTGTARLTRSNAPWRCETYLEFRTDDARAVAAPVGSVRAVLAALAGLLDDDHQTHSTDAGTSTTEGLTR